MFVHQYFVDFSLPKMKCKGRLIPHRIRKRVSIEELKTTKTDVAQKNAPDSLATEVICKVKEYETGFEVFANLPRVVKSIFDSCTSNIWS
jgi:hypothetical protein